MRRSLRRFVRSDWMIHLDGSSGWFNGRLSINKKGQKRVGFWRWCKKGNKRRAGEEEKEERKGYMYFELENQEAKGGIREGDEIQLSVSPGYAKFESGKCVL